MEKRRLGGGHTTHLSTVFHYFKGGLQREDRGTLFTRSHTEDDRYKSVPGERISSPYKTDRKSVV